MCMISCIAWRPDVPGAAAMQLSHSRHGLGLASNAQLVQYAVKHSTDPSSFG